MKSSGILLTERARWLRGWALVLFAAVLPVGQALTETALVVGLLAWAVVAAKERRRPRMLTDGLALWLAAWLVIALCSFMNSVDYRASLQGMRKLLKYFALYALVLESATTSRMLRRVLLGCLVGVLLVSVDGAWQAVFGRDLFYRHAPAYAFETVRRITATFHHPAELGIYLVSFCPMALAWGLAQTGRRRRALLAVAALGVAVLLLSRTRGGFLGMLAAFAVLAFWLRRWAPVACAALVAGVQALTTPAAVKAWAATMPSLLHRLTEPERLMYWQAALNMIKDHPLIGVGTNTFIKAYPHYRMVGDHFDTVGPYAHNQYLHQTAELGFAGLAVFLMVLVRVVVAAHRQRALSGPGSPEVLTAAGLGAGFVGYLVFGLFESSLFYARGSLIFWFLAALIMAAARVPYRRPLS